LPIPDFAIADVGSTIYRVAPGSWHSWTDWDEHIAADWRGLSATELQNLLHGLPGLRLQEKEKQNRHKLSFYVPLEADIPALISQWTIACGGRPCTQTLSGASTNQRVQVCSTCCPKAQAS
jgi:sucrose-6-phosphatase